MFEYLQSMSFREKSLWVSAAILLYLLIFYLDEVGTGFFDGSPGREDSLSIFIAMVVVVVVLEVASHIILAVISPSQANAPADERDRLIAWRAASHTSWMLGAGVITLAMVAMFRDIPSVELVHALILLMIVIEFLSDALQIYYYRRGF